MIEPRPLDGAEEPIRAWEQRTGYRFPLALMELYATEALIPSGVNGTEPWVLPLTEVWHQYSNLEPPIPLGEVLNHTERPERVDGDVEPGPYFFVQAENQGCWLIYVRATGEDDPPTYATDGGPFFFQTSGTVPDDPWCYVGRFTEVLFNWFAFYYHRLEFEIPESFVPLKFMSHVADPDSRHLAPPKPYRNGLWLRAPDEPFQPPVIDFLIDHFGEPQRTPRPGNVTTYTFHPEGGTIRITADEPALTGGLSAWWVHAQRRERLAELARLVLPWGTLHQTLRADTDPAREVLTSARN
jgi:hypothetical protein